MGTTNDADGGVGAVTSLLNCFHCNALVPGERVELFGGGAYLCDACVDEATRDDASADGPESSTEPDADRDNTESRDAWAGADFANPETDTYAPERLAVEQWTARKGKLPYAPWTDPDDPAPCTNSVCAANDDDDAPEEITDACKACQRHRDDDPLTTAECDHSARWKWSYRENYRDGETVARVEDDPEIDGRAFIQHEDDGWAFVDGDNVRCPGTGDVHPAFVAILDHLGLTYADVSVSGRGVHASYRGE